MCVVDPHNLKYRTVDQVGIDIAEFSLHTGVEDACESWARLGEGLTSIITIMSMIIYMFICFI